MDLDAIRLSYAGRAEDEWDRLESTPITRTEYLITSHCLERYLPEAGLILDAGSGPGRYAIDLARRGYRVVMFDLLREMLALGRKKVAESGVGSHVRPLVEGNLCSLPHADGTFDAVVSLGAPISHLTTAAGRSLAASEFARVVKPGGAVIITGTTWLAGWRSAVYWPCWWVFDRRNEHGIRGGGLSTTWCTWYSFGVGELEGLVEASGLQVVDRIGCEGLAAHLPLEHLEQVEAHPAYGPLWRKVLVETCNEPSIIGVSNHLLVVARKPRAREGQARDGGDLELPRLEAGSL